MLAVVAVPGQRREDVLLLDDIVREGARRILAAALEAEVSACGHLRERPTEGAAA